MPGLRVGVFGELLRSPPQLAASGSWFSSSLFGIGVGPGLTLSGLRALFPERDLPYLVRPRQSRRIFSFLLQQSVGFFPPVLL